MQRLLASAVADPSVTVRRTILEALSRTTALESHLAQAECLRSLFVGLNDESSTVRSLTIQLAGHISGANPAYVLPALRRHLMQLLSDMDHSPDSRQREGACCLRGLGWCLSWLKPPGGPRCKQPPWCCMPACPDGSLHPPASPNRPAPDVLQRARGCWAC